MVFVWIENFYSLELLISQFYLTPYYLLSISLFTIVDPDWLIPAGTIIFLPLQDSGGIKYIMLVLIKMYISNHIWSQNASFCSHSFAFPPPIPSGWNNFSFFCTFSSSFFFLSKTILHKYVLFWKHHSLYATSVLYSRFS